MGFGSFLKKIGRVVGKVVKVGAAVGIRAVPGGQLASTLLAMKNSRVATVASALTSSGSGGAAMPGGAPLARVASRSALRLPRRGRKRKAKKRGRKMTALQRRYFGRGHR